METIPDDFTAPTDSDGMHKRLNESRRLYIVGLHSSLYLQKALYVIKGFGIDINRCVEMTAWSKWKHVNSDDVGLILFRDPFKNKHISLEIIRQTHNCLNSIDREIGRMPLKDRMFVIITSDYDVHLQYMDTCCQEPQDILTDVALFQKPTSEDDPHVFIEHTKMIVDYYARQGLSAKRFEDAKNLLRQHKILAINRLRNSGKTSLATKLMADLSVLLQRPNAMKYIRFGDVSMVLVEDFTARFRLGVDSLKFWQDSPTRSSLTVVKIEEEEHVVDPVPAEDKHLGKDLQFENDADDSTIIRLSKLIAHNQVDDEAEKVTPRALYNFQEITDLPRNKLQPRPVKIQPNSVTIIVLPGRRKRPKRSQRSRSINLNSQNPSGANEAPTPGTAVQVSETDAINQRPSRDVTVTSIETIFRRTGIPTATTNLMSSIESEERLAIRRQGPTGSRPQVLTLRPPRYPDFADETRRKTSFANWPEDSMQDPTHMAKHGFFFTGREDLVRCYQCGIGMKDWSETFEPVFEHIRHSPECSFLLELLGLERLAAYKVNLIPSGAQPATRSAVQNTAHRHDQGTGVFTTTTGTSSNTTVAASSDVRSPQYKTLESRIQSFRNGWPSSHAQTPAQLSEAGFYFTGYGDVCRCFTCDGGLQRWDPQDDPWIEHTRWFPECDHVRQTRGQEYIDLVQRAANQSDEDDDPAVVMQTPGTASITGAMEGLSMTSAEDIDPETENDPEYLQRENQRLKMIIKCVKCEIRDANILFIPCTHHKMCEECAEDTLLCPACGRDIDKKVKTYMS